MFENRVLRRIFWPKSDEVTGEWRKLHNWELDNLHWIWMELDDGSAQACTLDGHLHRVTYTRCSINTADFPDEHRGARNT